LIRVAESQIDADGQVEKAKVQLEAAKIVLERSEKLLRDKAGSVRALDEAKAQVAVAEATLRAAYARRELLGSRVLEVTNPKSVWVRVPVYVGDPPKLKTTQEVRVGGLADAARAPAYTAKPVAAPPSANPGAGTVDLFYEMANNDGALRLGQKVGVLIPLQEPEEGLVVPASAVVHDIQGGTWVYENTAPQTFVRRRVQIRSLSGQDDIVAFGLKPGAKVVANGTAELFGTEFGIGK
jgi:multidrug efflux pump subunit AcrA (membrane-fusion protein)